MGGIQAHKLLVMDLACYWLTMVIFSHPDVNANMIHTKNNMSPSH